MIDAKDLNRCIENLAEINANLNSSSLKRLVLEVGYILKQELDLVNEWNERFKKDKKVSMDNIDLRKLLEDNTQLYNENKKMQEVIIRMKEVIDTKIPSIENAITNVNGRISAVVNSLT